MFRRLLLVGCTMLSLSVGLGSVNTAVAGHAPYRYQGQRVHFAGEANMIAAINSIGVAMAYPLQSELHVRAAEMHLNAALRFSTCAHVAGDLNGALQMLNAFRYRGDRGTATDRVCAARSPGRSLDPANRVSARPAASDPPIRPATLSARGVSSGLSRAVPQQRANDFQGSVFDHDPAESVTRHTTNRKPASPLGPRIERGFFCGYGVESGCCLAQCLLQ
jgi:hypothetical protein